MNKFTESDWKRFWPKVDLDNCRPCWVWKGSKSGRYGSFWWNGVHRYTHRIIYEIAHGSDPGELNVCHECDNPLCVNPAHLFLGAQKKNLEDMVVKGRSNFGHRHYNARFTPKQIADIRQRAVNDAKRGRIQRIANAYGVCNSQIAKIVRGVIYNK